MYKRPGDFGLYRSGRLVDNPGKVAKMHFIFQVSGIPNDVIHKSPVKTA